MQDKALVIDDEIFGWSIGDLNKDKLRSAHSAYELLEDDIDKRLYISIFNRMNGQREDEFLGAMSFGLHNIVSEIRGWFYLLMGELGLSKHLRYIGKKIPVNHISAINADVKWMDSYSMTLTKKNGFGFSLNGNSPVYVSRLNPGSSAEQCGLKKGDCFVRIGGMNVSRSSADSVARILRQCGNTIKLEVQRPRQQGSNRPASMKVVERDLSPQQRIEKLSVSPWKPSRRTADGNSRPTSFVSQMVSSSSHENVQLQNNNGAYMQMNSNVKMTNRAPQPLPHNPECSRRPTSKPLQRPLSTALPESVDYGWVDANGYVQRNMTSTLPRQPKSMLRSRPTSYCSTRDDDDPHYEVIEDGYYGNEVARGPPVRTRSRAVAPVDNRYRNEFDNPSKITRVEVHQQPELGRVNPTSKPRTQTTGFYEHTDLMSRSSLSKSEQDLLQAQAEFNRNYSLSPKSPRITRYILNTPRAPFSNIDDEEFAYKRSKEINELSKRFYNRAYELQNSKSNYKMPEKTPIRPIMQRYRESYKENSTMI